MPNQLYIAIIIASIVSISIGIGVGYFVHKTFISEDESIVNVGAFYPVAKKKPKYDLILKLKPEDFLNEEYFVDFAGHDPTGGMILYRSRNDNISPWYCDLTDWDKATTDDCYKDGGQWKTVNVVKNYLVLSISVFPWKDSKYTLKNGEFNDTKQGILQRKVLCNQDPNSGVCTRTAPRIESRQIYNGGFFVLDVQNLPYGQSFWPAYWFTSANVTPQKPWPIGGEIDIIEIVNDNVNVKSTLHNVGATWWPPGNDPSGINCGLTKLKSGSNEIKERECKNVKCEPKITTDEGTRIKDNNCSQDMGTLGCTAREPGAVILNKDDADVSDSTYGGGIWAMEWIVDDYIKMWYFPRTKTKTVSIPKGLQIDDKEKIIEISTLGKPYVTFDLKGTCDKSTNAQLKDMKMILNITLCGDWAGKVYDDHKGNTGINECNNYLNTMDINKILDTTQGQMRIRGFKFFM